MSAIISATALRRRFRSARRSLPELLVWSWFVIALGLTAALIVLVISSTAVLAILGVAMLVHVLPWAALLALCVTFIAAAIATVIRRSDM